MNQVKYSQYDADLDLPIDYTFSDEDGTLGIGASGATFFSPIGTEMEAAQYKIPVIYTPRLYQVEAADFMAGAVRGQRVSLLQDGGEVAMFYLTAISGGKKLQGGRYLCYLEGTDIAGLYATRPHAGDVYTGKTFIQVLREITGHQYTWIGSTSHPALRVLIKGSRYDLDPLIAIDNYIWNQSITGRLPYEEDGRINMRRLLEYVGAHIEYRAIPPDIHLSWTTPGEVVAWITTDWPGTPVEISPYKTYVGDSYLPADDIGTVAVNEYSYLDLNDTPTETIYKTDVAVSGALIKFDKPMAELTATGLTINSSSANHAIVTGTGTLVGRPYIVTVREISDVITAEKNNSKLLDNPLATSLVAPAMLDRFSNYIANAKKFSSAFVSPGDKGAGSFVRIEDPLGNLRNSYVTKCEAIYSGITKATSELVTGWVPVSGAAYTQRVVMTSSGTLTVPDGAVRMRLYLIQGGKGGWGGYPGESKAGLEATAGGAAGEGGDPGKVYIVDVEEEDLAASYAVTIGSPGAAGAVNHGEGSEGTHTTATGGGKTFSSNDGQVPVYGITDPIDPSKIYAKPGQPGVYAGIKGHGQGEGYLTLTDTETAVTSTTTWGQGNYRSGGSSYIDAYGGGPAYGSNGGNAEARGRAGNGASAVLDGFGGYTAPIPSYGSGGIGGNGGGGAGYGYVGTSWGLPGNGSKGGAGAQGVLIALFAFGTTPTPVPEENYLLDSDGEQLYDFYYERLAAQEE